MRTKIWIQSPTASIHIEADTAVWGNYSIISSLADPMEMLLSVMKRTVLQRDNFLPDKQLGHRQRRDDRANVKFLHAVKRQERSSESKVKPKLFEDIKSFCRVWVCSICRISVF